MKKEEFLRLLQEALEFQGIELRESTMLKGIEGYDSMSVMTVIAFVDEHFSKRLTAKQLAEITTVGTLMELVGIENFSD
ncbi:MAG: phosphopantetheine-binding protein [Bacteroidota bacterium]